MSAINESILTSLLASEQDSYKSELLRKLASSAIENKKIATPEQLKKLYTKYNEEHIFRPGDVVKWKSGLKDRKLPLDGEPAIVLNVSENPVFDSQNDAGSHYFREPYDIRLGVVGANGAFVIYHCNSKRFEPYDN